MSSSSSSTSGLSQTLLNTMNGTTSSSPTSSSTGSTSSSATSGADLQTTFLKLLVTQMQNQDPTNPMDSSQMTSQLAQINTVSGIQSLNTTLSSLATQLNATQQTSAAALIGKNVMAPGNSISVASGAASNASVTLGGAATSVTATVLDRSGNTVKTIDLGAQSTAGTVSIGWDGTTASGAAAPDGNYTFKVNAVNGTNAVTATTLAQSQVASVAQQSDGSTGLVLKNGNTVALSSVTQIL
jgi:flagellar basal-body rod modification protein FlgD